MPYALQEPGQKVGDVTQCGRGSGRRVLDEQAVLGVNPTTDRYLANRGGQTGSIAWPSGFFRVDLSDTSPRSAIGIRIVPFNKNTEV